MFDFLNYGENISQRKNIQKRKNKIPECKFENIPKRSKQNFSVVSVSVLSQKKDAAEFKDNT